MTDEDGRPAMVPPPLVFPCLLCLHIVALALTENERSEAESLKQGKEPLLAWNGCENSQNEPRTRLKTSPSASYVRTASWRLTQPWSSVNGAVVSQRYHSTPTIRASKHVQANIGASPCPPARGHGICCSLEPEQDCRRRLPISIMCSSSTAPDIIIIITTILLLVSNSKCHLQQQQ